MIQNNKFVSRDINLAATLMTLGFHVAGIQFQIEGNENHTVGYFAFERTPELEQAERDYWNRALKIEPREFTLNMRSLKSQVSNIYKAPPQD